MLPDFCLRILDHPQKGNGGVVLTQRSDPQMNEDGRKPPEGGWMGENVLWTRSLLVPFSTIRLV